MNEILGFLSGSDYKVFILQAKDKYGDMGIVGAAVVGEKGDKYIIKNFMLSCRVFDRGFEYILLDTIRKCVKGKCFMEYIIRQKKMKCEGPFMLIIGLNVLIILFDLWRAFIIRVCKRIA